jgi:hypothetical protein
VGREIVADGRVVSVVVGLTVAAPTTSTGIAISARDGAPFAAHAALATERTATRIA